ncbi:hypothetical protein [Megasphaera sp.]|jgi:hypothetical protein|uniref:hypothetical protein n=1 Tax=Megasphaera sp. TaxID=2023260 RepID=UPI0035209C58
MYALSLGDDGSASKAPPSETASMEIAKNLQLDNTYIYMDPENGWKISYFISNAKTLDYHNPKQVSQALNMIRKLHTSGLSTPYSFDIWKQIHSFEKTLKEKGRENFEGAKQLRELVNKIHAVDWHFKFRYRRIIDTEKDRFIL